MARADVGSKWLIGQSPEAWVRWVLDDPALVVEEQLSTDFQHVSRLSDSLLRVKDGDETFLVLTELQLRYDERMPRRVRSYAALAEEKYALPVYPIVFNLLPPGGGKAVAERYHSEFRGLEARQDFRVVKAWELDAEEILRQRNLVLVPFVPLMRGADEDTIRRGAQILRQEPIGEQLESVLALFASFVLDTETIQQIVRWNMVVLERSPWYQEIVLRGVRDGLRDSILRVLQTRFALDPMTKARLSDQVATIEDSDLLENLVSAAVQAESLEAFEDVLAQG